MFNDEMNEECHEKEIKEAMLFTTFKPTLAYKNLLEMRQPAGIVHPDPHSRTYVRYKYLSTHFMGSFECMMD